MQESMQKVVFSNIRDQILGDYPFTYNNQAIYQVCPWKLQCTK